METLEKLKENGVHLKYDEVAQLCDKYHIEELSICGSSIRDDFTDKSDIDILVAYKPKAKISLFDEVDLMNEFSNLIKRSVDICDIRSLKNPIRREEILSTREVVFVCS